MKASLRFIRNMASTTFAICALTGSAQEVAWRETRAISAPEAHQAAAAKGEHVYAISSRVVAKYERSSGKRVALSSGKAKHLNSGFFWNEKLYCAHSNY